MKHRRIMGFRFSPEIIIGFLLRKGTVEIKADIIPKGAKYLFSDCENKSGSIVFYFEHKSFAPVPYLGLIPVKNNYFLIKKMKNPKLKKLDEK